MRLCASDAPGPGSSPGGHTIKKNEFFKIRSFIDIKKNHAIVAWFEKG